jgi:serine/threonine protein kinase
LIKLYQFDNASGKPLYQIVLHHVEKSIPDPNSYLGKECITMKSSKKRTKTEVKDDSTRQHGSPVSNKPGERVAMLSSFRAGQEVGRYHILEQIGEGGMATVFKAFDTQLERDVALKVIHPEFVRSEDFLKRFEREAKLIARQTHPNIVSEIDYGVYENVPYMVMEYVQGGTLKEKMGKPQSWQEAARLLAPIARALEAAHRQKIVHRDVKPGNILLTQTGEPMLSDFGIAKLLETSGVMDLTRPGVGMGTPEYMAPEQGLGQAVDHRADIYSLGVVFYEMVTGRTPYQADTPMAVMLKQMSESLPYPGQFVQGLPEAVMKVMFKALAKDPAERYQDAGSFAIALERLVHGQALEEIKHPGRSKWVPILAWVALGLLVVAVAAAWIIVKNDQKTKLSVSLTETAMVSLVNTTTEPGSAGDSISLVGAGIPGSITPVDSSISSSGATPGAITGETPTPGSICSFNPLAETSLSIGQEKIDQWLPGAKVVWYDNFDANCSNLLYGYNFGMDGNSTIEVRDGIVSLMGGTGPSSSVNITSNAFTSNHGVLILLKYSPETVGFMLIQPTIYNDTFWGILYSDQNPGFCVGDLNHGTNSKLNDFLRPDNWYYLLLTIDDQGNAYSRIWEKDDPTRQKEWTYSNPAWGGVDWIFATYFGQQGLLSIDEYVEFEIFP